MERLNNPAVQFCEGLALLMSVAAQSRQWLSICTIVRLVLAMKEYRVTPTVGSYCPDWFLCGRWASFHVFVLAMRSPFLSKLSSVLYFTILSLLLQAFLRFVSVSRTVSVFSSLVFFHLSSVSSIILITLNARSITYELNIHTRTA